MRSWCDKISDAHNFKGEPRDQYFEQNAQRAITKVKTISTSIDRTTDSLFGLCARYINIRVRRYVFRLFD